MINNSFITYCLSEYPNLKLKLKSKIQIKQQKYYIQKKTETFLKHLLLENRLKKKIFDSIRLLYNINSYRGIRHKRGLPVRGQRTHTNASTQKKMAKNRLSFSKKNES